MKKHSLAKNKKGGIAPILTLALVFINILVYIILYAFAHDGVVVGTTQMGDTISVNQSETSASISYSDRSWISRLFFTLNNLPFWLKGFVGIFQITIIAVIILAWVRGE